MRLPFARLLLIATAVGACSPTPDPTTSEAVFATVEPLDALGTLIVQQSSIVGGLYTEGAVAYVEVSDLDGTQVASVEDPEYRVAKELMRVDLSPGRYVIGTYVRPCEAACPILDAPTDGCELPVDLVAGATIEVRVERRVGQPCRASIVGAPRCPPLPFDAAAELGPEFDQESFVRDESSSIAQGLLDGLAAIYAHPETADVCRIFTEQGWLEARASDARLGAVERGESLIEQRHVLRVAFEGSYDLRDRPPVVPLDIIYDIPAGATTKDLPSGDTQTSTTDQRAGFHVDITSDGHRWRIDRFGPVGEDYDDLLAMPTIPPVGPPCTRFIQDPEGAPFDDGPERVWCDADGEGRTITRNQVVLLTRYPCDEGKAAILHIGRPLGTRLDPLVRWEYVRDPAGEFLAQSWVSERYDGHATMPKDAAYTGWTNGNIELWISPTELDRAVYVVRGDAVERWPRAAASWGVMDCN